MSKMSDYIEQQLGAAGFVLCNATIAYRLRRDMWSGRTGVEVSGEDARKHLATLASQEPLTLFTFSGEGLTGFGATFNAENISERVQQTFGLKLKFMLMNSFPEPAPAPDMQEPKRLARWQERLDKLNKLAAQEPPSEDCALRREILEAREILASPELMARERQRF